MRNLVTELRSEESLDPLMERIGDARFVLLGEASHGTSEYYTWRLRLSKRLIREKGFNFIAVEGDWPDCYSLNRFVKGGIGSEIHASGVLHKFDRWPTWMWANWEVAGLGEWMRRHNVDLPEQKKVGFYGLDVYSLWESLDAVCRHLINHHPDQIENAMAAISCFEPFNREGQAYAWHSRMVAEHCETEVAQLLTELLSRRMTAHEDPESHFEAEQNAFVIADAERYYRAMIRSDVDSWNIRDQHMTETLERLCAHHGADCKAIVWEHNTHVGDARATDMQAAGMANVGQLVRERHAKDGVVLVGFGSHEGSVIAADRWGAPMRNMPVPQSREGSWERLFHDVGLPQFLMACQDAKDLSAMTKPRGHRAIGVVYHPEQEAYGNYVPTDLLFRYDAFLFFDRTKGLHPLHIDARSAHEPPETYPWGD